MDKPFVADYAKSGRSICRGCSQAICKDTFRLAIMLPSTSFDGIVPNWYHYQCFFVEHMPHTINDITDYASLRPEDKRTVQDIIKKGVCPFQKEDLQNEISAAASKASINNYKIEYTPASSRTKCQHCTEKIPRDEMRVFKKTTKKPFWYHFPCFAKVNKDLNFLECGSELPGFDDLKDEDQEIVKKDLPGYTSPPKKKRISLEKEQTVPQEEDDDEDTKIMKEFRAELKSNLTKDQLITLLKANRQCISSAVNVLLDRASDMLTYGAVMKCPKCKYSQLVYCKTGYRCSGSGKARPKCSGIYPDVIRTPVEIPMELRLRHDFLQFYEYVERKRKVEHSKSSDISRGSLLYYRNIVLEGFSVEDQAKLRSMVKQLGGRVVPEVRRSVLLVVATNDAVTENTPAIQTARECEVYVVSRDLLDEAVVDAYEDIDTLIRKYSLCNWGAELHNRVPRQFQRFNRPNSSRYRGTEEEEGTRKMRVKNGVAIEPDSGLEDVAHVYQAGAVAFNAVLTRADLFTNKNSYYKIQLLESDNLDEYWIYSSWGRIGTDSAGHKLKSMENLASAKTEFKALFKKWTGDLWENRHYIVERSGSYNYVEVDYQAKKEEIVELSTHVAGSVLEPAVADLMAMIFNVQAMEKLMLEYELNIKQMPLGKLSRAQVSQGYNILRQILWTLEGSAADKTMIKINSSIFYSVIPHCCGLKTLPLLDNKDLIKKKCEMLENLMEIETAYSMIQRTVADGTGNPLDSYYSQLNSDIVTLKEENEEYRLIEEYVNNTHGQTHSNFDLKILELFKVQRHEEEDRYKPFSTLHNRKLLWHGSRVTNFAGILSQGLRIAPPEAPTTGFMFGKGIYFADMVSKSANYCCTTSTETEGLLLLCEVALGNVAEKYDAENIKKLPKNVHSVKGVGRTSPNPVATKVLPDGVEVPLGTPLTSVDGHKKLQYNEYIVYDPAQVYIKYLLKLDFKYKHNK